VDYICNDDPRVNDELLRSLPHGSMVINATGRGKDSAGSPITDEGLFPMNGIAWELNYRGELDFLQQARRQAERRNVSVHDGWEYFVFGWTAVIEQVLHLNLTDDRLREMSQIAKAFAPVNLPPSNPELASVDWES
jgi:shikimate 5-dehydrogenase